MKVVYVYYGNHYLFNSWTSAISAEKTSFVPSSLFDFKHLKSEKKTIAYHVSNFFRGKPALLQLLAIIKKTFLPKADVYIAENVACLSAIPKRKNSKIILFYGDQFFIDYPNMTGAKKLFIDKQLKKVDAYITISDLYDSLAKPHLKVPSKMVYPYVNADTYSKHTADVENKDIGFIGYLVALKGLDILTEAFLELQPKHQNKLKLIGSKVDSIPIIEENIDNPNITITGWADSPELELKSCGNYINPAYKEAFGINILEAMCMQIPPIVSKNCGAAEIVKKIEPKLVIPAEKNAIIKAYEWLNSDMKRKKELGKKCKQEAVKYTKKKSISEFKVAFSKIIEELGASQKRK